MADHLTRQHNSNLIFVVLDNYAYYAYYAILCNIMHIMQLCISGLFLFKNACKISHNFLSKWVPVLKNPLQIIITAFCFPYYPLQFSWHFHWTIKAQDLTIPTIFIYCCFFRSWQQIHSFVQSCYIWLPKQYLKYLPCFSSILHLRSIPSAWTCSHIIVTDWNIL